MNLRLILIINDPADISKRELVHVGAGVCLADWIIDRYGHDGFSVHTSVFIGGLDRAHEIDHTDFAQVNIEITEPVYIVHTPGAVAVPYLIYAAVAIAAAVAVAVLMPVPKMDGVGGRSQKASPNNALSDQSNIARALDRVADIFGKINSYPDLIAPTVTQYIDHVKFQDEYLCVGRGYYQLENFRSGDTDLDLIPGSSWEHYEPGQSPPQVLKTRQSNEVASQVLKGPNEVVVAALDDDFSLSYAAGSDIATISRAPRSFYEYFDGIETGQTVTATDLYAVSSEIYYSLDGDYAVGVVTNETIELLAAATVNANWTLFDGTTEEVQTVLTAHGLLSPGETVESTDVKPLLSLPDSLAAVGPFVVPGDDNGEVWIDLIASKGLAVGEELNQTRQVHIDSLFEQIDDNDNPTGASFIYPVELADNTVDPRFWTFKVSQLDGLIPGERYRVTMTRTNNSGGSSFEIVDEIRWSRLAGIEDISEPDTTGTTRVTVSTQATEQVAALQERKFNVDATRKTVTWSGSTAVGDIETGVGLLPSRRFADALLHYFLDQKLGAGSISNIDAAGLYAIQSELDAQLSGEKGEFSYTFDDPNTPALEEMRQIAAACRCFVFRDGSVFGVTRDQAQPVARALFNRRNKLPDSESRTLRFNRPLDNDGVALEYNDIDTGDTKTITLPDDLPESDPHYSLPGSINPLKIEAIGVRQYAQAWDRAQYELRKQIYSRITLESSVGLDGALVPLNGRVQHVDGTRISALTSDGEIKTIDGLTVTTSERCDFSGAGVHSAILRDEYGEPSLPIIVTPSADTDFGFVLSSLPQFDIVVRGELQRGSLYNFGPDGNEVSEAYLVQRKIPDENGNVKLEMINYSDEYYASDTETPPNYEAA